MWTFFIVYLTCIPLGIAKAVRDGSGFDVASSTVILVGYAIPGFVLGITLIVLFGGGSFWSIFPLRGLVSDNWSELSWGAKILDYLWHMVLPIFSSAVGSLAVMTMLTKNSFLEEIGKQYVLTARAKGLKPSRVIGLHALRNAMIPVITVIGLQVGVLFAGAILTETIFSWPGIGKWMVDSIFRRDYASVQGGLLLIAVIIMVVNLVVDLLYGLINPRIRHTE